jgi:hypothetical protein
MEYPIAIEERAPAIKPFAYIRISDNLTQVAAYKQLITIGQDKQEYLQLKARGSDP